MLHLWVELGVVGLAEAEVEVEAELHLGSSPAILEVLLVLCEEEKEK